MKIFNAGQIRSAEAHTISKDNLAAGELMERAAHAAVSWIETNFGAAADFTIVCGTGNNGGDGLAIARLLAGRKKNVTVFIIHPEGKKSADFEYNLRRLENSGIAFETLTEGQTIPELNSSGIIIDAVFGTGLNRPPEKIYAAVINKINDSGSKIISIDIPSGLNADVNMPGPVVNAAHTLSFQFPKLAFLLPSSGVHAGDWHLLDIGLKKEFISQLSSDYFIACPDEMERKIKVRSKFSHKGNYGHSLIVAGSRGKIGAAVLAARACLRSGSGLLTVHLPAGGVQVIHACLPEAMVTADISTDVITHVDYSEKYSATGIGPGIGTTDEARDAFTALLRKNNRPMVIDADALNILSMHPDLFSLVPAGSILTPHPKEFARMAGGSTDDFERLKKQIEFSKRHKIIVALKGAHTSVSSTDGKVFFNTTGNPAMAKGGSGDVLTGVITAMLSQGYEPFDAACMGVYLHGKAADKAMKKFSGYSLLATDIIECL